MKDVLSRPWSAATSAIVISLLLGAALVWDYYVEPQGEFRASWIGIAGIVAFGTFTEGGFLEHFLKKRRARRESSDSIPNND